MFQHEFSQRHAEDVYSIFLLKRLDDLKEKNISHCKKRSYGCIERCQNVGSILFSTVGRQSSRNKIVVQNYTIRTFLTKNYNLFHTY